MNWAVEIPSPGLCNRKQYVQLPVNLSFFSIHHPPYFSFCNIYNFLNDFDWNNKPKFHIVRNLLNELKIRFDCWIQIKLKNKYVHCLLLGKICGVNLMQGSIQSSPIFSPSVFKLIILLKTMSNSK